jgi:hypothetical protein
MLIEVIKLKLAIWRYRLVRAGLRRWGDRLTGWSGHDSVALFLPFPGTNLNAFNWAAGESWRPFPFATVALMLIDGPQGNRPPPVFCPRSVKAPAAHSPGLSLPPRRGEPDRTSDVN